MLYSVYTYIQNSFTLSTIVYNHLRQKIKVVRFILLLHSLLFHALLQVEIWFYEHVLLEFAVCHSHPSAPSTIMVVL